MGSVFDLWILGENIYLFIALVHLFETPVGNYTVNRKFWFFGGLNLFLTMSACLLVYKAFGLLNLAILKFSLTFFKADSRSQSLKCKTSELCQTVKHSISYINLCSIRY